MNITELVHDAIENRGGTYQLISWHPGGLSEYQKVEHDFGYYVSKPRGVENMPYLSSEMLEGVVVRRHFSTGAYIGLWRDEHGNWSIDETLWYADGFSAINKAIENYQRAIWNIEYKVEEYIL